MVPLQAFHKLDIFRSTGYACIALLLAACGGGGDGESNPNSPSPNATGINSVPFASAAASPASGKAALQVQLDATQSLDLDGQITSYAWDFGDGQTGSGEIANHTYSTPGEYTAILSITDDKGALSTHSVIIEVQTANVAPNASFSANATAGNAPFIVSLDAASSSDTDGEITAYHWDFGDNTSGSGVNTSHTYNSPGTYTVKLTVTDDDGAMTSVDSNITAIATSTLRGTMSATLASVIDSDVNDSNAAYNANNSDSTAQSLPNPVIVGGYLNIAQTGPNGDSYLSGDTSDFFHIALISGQTITVTIADASAADLDLMLYHDDGSVDPSNPDFLSSGSGINETLTVTTSGDYFIEVAAISGFSNYTLVVGEATLPSTTSTLASTDDFIAGDVIVKFKDNLIGSLQSETPNSKAKKLGLSLKRGNNKQHPSLMGLGEAQHRKNTFNTLGITPGNGRAPRNFKANDPEKQLKFETMQVIKALRKRDDVLYAEPNYIHRKNAVPNDQYYPLQWHYPQINLPAAWDISTGSADVIVAVLDTGVLLTHPDMIGQFSSDGGYDFISSNTNSGDGENGIDANPDDPGDNPGAGSSFHGTHVAGTIAAATNFSGGGTGDGVAGIAPNAKIMPIRVLGQLGGSSYDIMQGLRYAAGLSNDSGITLNASQRSDIINLSLGREGGYSQAEQDLYTAIRNSGVIIIAAAGNNNSSASFYPAAYSGVISVSAVDYNKQKAYYSNFGSAVDVAAPGGDTTKDLDNDGHNDGVLSPAAGDSGGPIVFGHYFFQGTSMASPHVAGVIALMKSIYSDLTPAEVDTLLQSGKIIDDLGSVGRDDTFGHGLINAHKAALEAQALAAAAAETPVLGLSASTLNLGLVGASAVLTASNTGNGSLSITSVSSNETWLSVTPITVDGAQLGTYRVTVNRSGLTPGYYQAEISFASSANDVTVSVSMQIAPVVTDADAGYHYVLLIDAADNSLVDSWHGPVQNGHYQFQFDQVVFPAGQEYYLIGGSDLNNNGYICDAGEACGGYLVSGSLSAIGVNSSHNGLNFVTDFGVEFRNTSLFNTLDQLPLPVRQ